MAFLRSDVINKDLIDNVLSKVEGTTKIVLETLTVGPSTTGKASLLEERYGILVTAKVKHQPQTYYWIAKVLSPEIETSNYARFQGILETECNFYAKFIPELSRLGAPLPQFYPLVHCNYAKLGREILLLEDMTKYGFKQSVCDPKGLDLAHTINVIEWLARLHGLGYVSINNHRDGSKGWLSQNPWIRKEEQERKAKAQPMTADETDAEGIRSRLMNMAANALKSKVDGTPKVEKCLQRQNWLDDLREEMWANEGSIEARNCFKTILHGEPWHGNVLFQYKTDPEGFEYPTKAVLGDLQTCSYGKPGSDIAHFLLTSTTREFRKEYLGVVLKAYHLELEDVIQSQGVDLMDYSLKDLMRDYKQGLVLGITFCLFAMPMLTEGDERDLGHKFGPIGDTVDSEDLFLSPTITNKILEGLQELLEEA